MGGNSATQQAITPQTTGFPGSPGMYSMPPAPPGFLDQIAAGLQAGYGGNQPQFVNSIYKPMTFPSFSPAVGSPVAAPAPIAPPVAMGGQGTPSGVFGTIPYEQLISR